MCDERVCHERQGLVSGEGGSIGGGGDSVCGSVGVAGVVVGVVVAVVVAVVMRVGEVGVVASTCSMSWMSSVALPALS